MSRYSAVPMLIMIPIFYLSSSAQAAVQISYKDLSQPGARIPSGEVITINGDITDFDSGEKKFSDWMEFADVTINYTIEPAPSKELKARISANHRQWDVVLEALTAKSVLNLELKVKLRLTKAAAEKSIQNVLDSDNYINTAKKFLSDVQKHGADTNKLEGQFLSDFNKMVKNQFPQFLSVSGLSFGKQAADKNKITALINLSANKSDLITYQVPGIQKDTSLSKVYGAIKNLKSLKGPAEKTRNLFVRNYEKVMALKAALVENVTQTVTVTESLPTASISTADFQKYAGIDYGALYFPGSDELRQFVLVNIYWGKVEDSPDTGTLETNPTNWLQSRLSLTVGWSVGDLSNNTNSDIDGNNAFAVGLGLRLNKYFRASVGTVRYRSKTDHSMKGDAFYAVSIDLTAFDTLKGLVSK